MKRPVRFALLGVPFNSAGREDGVARAPSALRDAGLVDALNDAGADVTDHGDVALGRPDPVRDPASGLIDPAGLSRMIRSVRAEVQEIRRTGAVPLVIGGDCPILLGCLAAVPSPGLLFVDGHEDAWPPALSTTGEAADMELGFALGLTDGDLPSALRREIRTLDRNRVVVIGPRDETELAAAGVRSVSDVVDILRPDTVTATGGEHVAAHAAERLAGTGSWWFHVDLDVLSTVSLGAVDYPQPAGLGWEALGHLTRRALASPELVGWDVTIYNPDLDPDRSAARRIVDYICDSCAA